MDPARLFELPFVEAAGGGAALYLVARARRFLRQRPFHHIWDAILVDAEDVYIVYSDMALREFKIFGMDATSELPRNVPLLPVQEAVGISDLYRALRDSYRKRRIHMDSARDFRRYDKTIISIGGPSVNRVTNEFLNNRRIDSKFRMIYPDHVAEDDADETQYTCDERDGEIVHDYGFIFIAPNPLNRAHTFCALFGIWPQGSRAAVKTLVEPARSDAHYKHFIGRVKARSGVFGVVKAEVAGLIPGEPEFVKVRELG